MASPHPLDPLSATEIRRAAEVVREAVGPTEAVQYVAITLHEPAKEEAGSQRAPAPGRCADIVLHDRADNSITELTVALEAGDIVHERSVDGVQAPFLIDEWEPFVAAVKGDERYQAALERRGITDLDLISIDPIPYGHWGDDEHNGNGARLCRASSFLRERTPGGNRHARHVEGLICTVDLSALEVLAVDDHGVVPIPPDPGEYELEHLGPPRADLAPLEIHQPQGTSFEVDGWEVSWQKWRFRVGFNGREGLVLHSLGYQDGDALRSILHRASYTELAVTYADASPGHWFMSFFDFGELQAGALANSLELGCDCLGSIYYFDVTLANTQGEPYTLPNAICLHEEDYGTLWKHADLGERRSEVRRSRRLVISWIGTFGNYEYGFYWYLYQDGAIETEVKLTGILQTAVTENGARPESGALVAPLVNGMSHQHIFSTRLDFDLDGRDNTVEEVSAEPIPAGEHNPHGTAFATRRETLTHELEARRSVDQLHARVWDVSNPNVTNALGEPVRYRLVPGHNVELMAQPGSPFANRAAFARHHLHVTPYAPHERYATGDYPYQHNGEGGLPDWTEADRPIENTDTVLWYTFGHHHVPRPEDWPVMPVATIGFRLMPVGFFDRNPGLDVPPPSLASGHRCH
jgi:primary-amine oxidase